jgi:hypothetical protein
MQFPVFVLPCVGAGIEASRYTLLKESYQMHMNSILKHGKGKVLDRTGL